MHCSRNLIINTFILHFYPPSAQSAPIVPLTPPLVSSTNSKLRNHSPSTAVYHKILVLFITMLSHAIIYKNAHSSSLVSGPICFTNKYSRENPIWCCASLVMARLGHDNPWDGTILVGLRARSPNIVTKSTIFGTLRTKLYVRSDFFWGFFFTFETGDPR